MLISGFWLVYVDYCLMQVLNFDLFGYKERTGKAKKKKTRKYELIY